MQTWFKPLSVALFLSATCLGCGEGEKQLPATLSGTVMLDNAPLETGTVQVIPFDPKLGSDSAVGIISGGKYTASTNQTVKGLKPGDYQIAVHSWTKEPQLEIGIEGVSAIPAKYNDIATSNLRVTITAGKTNTYDIVLSSKE